MSLDAQQAKIRAYAELYSLELADVIVDAGLSAKTLDRPGLARALACELEALPGWTTWGNAWENAFTRGLERLQGYVDREGHARVPVAHKEAGYNLGAWVAFKRRDHKKGRLPEYQVKALEALPGWSWDARQESKRSR